jgi:hypothetical protein
VRNKKSNERESDLLFKDCNRHFLVWTAKNPIEKKFYFSDEELADLAKIDDNQEIKSMDTKLKIKIRKPEKNIQQFIKAIETSLIESSNNPNGLILEVMTQKQACNIHMSDFYFYLAKNIFNSPICGIKTETNNFEILNLLLFFII